VPYATWNAEYVKEVKKGIVRAVVRHEGSHGRVARRVAKEMGINVRYEYVIFLLDFGEEFRKYGMFGAGPMISFPDLPDEVGWSKERYIAFMDTMITDHDDPSDGDKIMRKYL